MKTKAIRIGTGTIALCVFVVWMIGIFASGPTPVVAANSSTQSRPAPEVPQVPACGPDWAVVSSPNVGTGDNYLLSSAAVGAHDIWAVGFYRDPTSRRLTLIEHWDGSSWSVVPSPNVGTSDNLLRAVVASSSNDVWAVGHWDLSGPGHQTLVEHWDGSSWSVVPSPNVGSYDNEFLGEARSSTNDIWAVGNYWNGARAVTLTEHWDGSSWTVVTSPNVGTYNNNLLTVSASAGNDAWAAGQTCGNPACDSSQVLIEHWDGSSWSISSSPNTGAVANILRGVDARANNDVWAVGEVCIVDCQTYRSLIEHWDGSIWSIVPGPDPGPLSSYRAVVALAANDAWAAGSYSNDGTTYSNTMAHWDGTGWTLVPVTNEGSLDNDLRAFSVISPGNIWVVGYFDNGSGARTQIQHYLGPCTTPTSTATSVPINTSTSTSTSTSFPTQTPGGLTATPTVCTLSFTDVPVGSTFYPYIQCLACLGIINGYPCGGPGEPCNPTNDPYFRPGNIVTRGQFAKIAANSAGFNEPTGAQQYEDVAPGSTFYDFIWRLSERGLVNGYPCGGVGEPCGPNNLPYFRPNTNVTRGQLSKIDANAAGFADTPTEQQFEDVVVGSTYYTYTYRLASRLVMSGYACGGGGEPCSPPDNLPYFRPNANATRGQSSKIVDNTFFPDCHP